MSVKKQQVLESQAAMVRAQIKSGTVDGVVSWEDLVIQAMQPAHTPYKREEIIYNVKKELNLVSDVDLGSKVSSVLAQLESEGLVYRFEQRGYWGLNE